MLWRILKTHSQSYKKSPTQIKLYHWINYSDIENLKLFIFLIIYTPLSLAISKSSESPLRSLPSLKLKKSLPFLPSGITSVHIILKDHSIPLPNANYKEHGTNLLFCWWWWSWHYGKLWFIYIYGCSFSRRIAFPQDIGTNALSCHHFEPILSRHTKSISVQWGIKTTNIRQSHRLEFRSFCKLPDLCLDDSAFRISNQGWKPVTASYITLNYSWQIIFRNLTFWHSDKL